MERCATLRPPRRTIPQMCQPSHTPLQPTCAIRPQGPGLYFQHHNNITKKRPNNPLYARIFLRYRALLLPWLRHRGLNGR
eukprot:3360391-Alexandrium_andersonii.AAC.1